MTAKKKKPPAKAKRKRPEYTISEHMYAISIKLEALASGQAMLSERFTSLLGIANHCDRLVKEKETLQKRVAALEMSAGIAAYDREIGNMPIPDGALEPTEETPEMGAILKKWADSYIAEPMERNIVWAKPCEAMSTYAKPVPCDHDILSPHATIRYIDGKRWCDACNGSPLPQWVSDLPPPVSHVGSVTMVYGTAKPEDMSRDMPPPGVLNMPSPYGVGAVVKCSIAHMHVHGIRCGVCGVQG
jgi:hypothetical protein